MPITQKSSYSNMDKKILDEEYVNTMKLINSFNIETPCYVYILFHTNGNPFYVGKGTGNRAWDHIKDYINGIKNNKTIEFEIFIDEPPIVFIAEGNLSSQDALQKEMELILRFGRKLGSWYAHE